MPEDHVQVPLTLSAGTAELLSALIDPDYGAPDLEGVIELLIDHARQGVMRPASWERPWLCSVFGHEWPRRLERDPDVPHHDRVRRDDRNGTPA